MNITTILASDWYQNLMQYIPDGKLFSWRSVFDGIPRIVQQLPTTLMLTVFGAFFGIMLALVFAIVKINRVRFIYPLQAFFVSFLKGTPILVQLMLTYYGIPRIVQQLPTTLMLTVFGAFFGIMLALVFAIVKINRVRFIYPLQAFFVSFLKGTPILVQLMLTYYGIPLALKALNQQWGTSLNINAIPAATFAIVAFAFNEAAYASETIRAAILSVNPGEIEAARSLGMTRAQVYRRVIIPNAAVVATPTLINSLIGLTKGTSLAFSAGVVEVFAQAQILGGADYRYFERFISVALVYWVVNIVIENIGRFIERKMAITAPDNVETDVKGELR